MRNYVRAFFLVLVLVFPATAQRLWLGDPDSVPDRVSSLGVHWNSAGFDVNRPNAIRKSLAKIAVHPETYSSAVYQQFSDLSSIYAASLPGWIDSQWQVAANEGMACGIFGVAPPYVVIRPTAWRDVRLPGLLLAGETDSVNGWIAVVNLFPSSQGYTANSRDLLHWEYVNWILCHSRFGCPKTITDEGHFPCAPPPVGTLSRWADNVADDTP